MFTTGSKHFLGLSALAFIAAVLYMIFVNPNDIGATALFALAGGAGLTAGFALFTRDGDVDTAEEAIEAARTAPGASIWPIATALGAALVLVGLATIPAWFVIGLGVTIASGLEWMIQNWADRASADRRFNSDVRERLIGGLEYPGLAAAILITTGYLFSRVMLAASKDGAAVIFIVVATLILGVGTLVATKPAFRGRLLATVVAVGALLLAGAGITTAFTGEREELTKAAKEDHFAAEHRECGPEKAKYWDKVANNKVSMRSAVTATVSVENGKVVAREIGLEREVQSITIARGNPVSVMFRNKDEKEYRLAVNLGKEAVGDTGVTEDKVDCTQLTGKDQEQILLLNIAKPADEGSPYSLYVPGLEGSIEVIVP
ncbi:MAG: hypothetical protein ACO3RB_03145 [Ilumatobacteraceae bacterium]